METQSWPRLTPSEILDPFMHAPTNPTRKKKQVFMYSLQQANSGIHNWCGETFATSTQVTMIWEEIILRAETGAWRQSIERKSKLHRYQSLKKSLTVEQYLSVPSNTLGNEILTALRSGTTFLRIKTGRWNGLEFPDRTCLVCGNGEG